MEYETCNFKFLKKDKDDLIKNIISGKEDLLINAIIKFTGIKCFNVESIVTKQFTQSGLEIFYIRENKIAEFYPVIFSEKNNILTANFQYKIF